MDHNVLPNHHVAGQQPLDPASPSTHPEAINYLPVVTPIIHSPVMAWAPQIPVPPHFPVPNRVIQDTEALDRWRLFCDKMQSSHCDRDSSGRSVLEEWIHFLPNQQYLCNVPMPNGRPCSKLHTRLDRAVAHVRKHLDSRPFACMGDCGTKGCSKAFLSQADLKQDIEEQVRQCPKCDRIVLRQNLTPHIKSCHLAYDAHF